jgi:ribosomal-protein-alanine N-acetyltransferase
MAKHLARPATLTGTRVRLRAPHVDDAEAMFDGLASDPEVTHYLSWIPHRGVVETRRVITKLFNVGLDPTGGFARGPTGNCGLPCGVIL